MEQSRTGPPALSLYDNSDNNMTSNVSKFCVKSILL